MLQYNSQIYLLQENFSPSTMQLVSNDLLKLDVITISVTEKIRQKEKIKLHELCCYIKTRVFFYRLTYKLCSLELGLATRDYLC